MSSQPERLYVKKGNRKFIDINTEQEVLEISKVEGPIRDRNSVLIQVQTEDGQTESIFIFPPSITDKDGRSLNQKNWEKLRALAELKKDNSQ